MLTAHIHAKTRTSLAPHHLFAAARLAKRIREVEQENQGKPFGAFYDEILHNALGVAMMTVASLESYANELYFEGSAIAPAQNQAFASEFQEIVDREPVLRKFSLILAIRSAKRLDLGCPEVQSVDALIKLRNAIVNVRSEWLGNRMNTQNYVNAYTTGSWHRPSYLTSPCFRTHGLQPASQIGRCRQRCNSCGIFIPRRGYKTLCRSSSREWSHSQVKMRSNPLFHRTCAKSRANWRIQTLNDCFPRAVTTALGHETTFLSPNSSPESGQ